MTLAVEVLVEAQAWSAIPDLEDFSRATIRHAAAFNPALVPPGAEVSVLFCDDTAIATLNRTWRGIDKPTNVLAFPARPAGAPGPDALLGDIIVAFETVAREARDKGLPLRDHVAHMLVHGFLHLAGHDHASDAQADAMEALETVILGAMGLADPYGADGPIEDEGAFL